MQSSFRVRDLVCGPLGLALILPLGPLLHPPVHSGRTGGALCLPLHWPQLQGWTDTGPAPYNRATLSANLVAALFPTPAQAPTLPVTQASAARAKDRIEGSVLSQQQQTWLAGWGGGAKLSWETSQQPGCVSLIMAHPHEMGKNPCWPSFSCGQSPGQGCWGLCLSPHPGCQPSLGIRYLLLTLSPPPTVSLTWGFDTSQSQWRPHFYRSVLPSC